MTRRSFVPGAASLALAATAAPQNKPAPGRLKQSVTRGVFGRGMQFEDMCRTAADLGFQGFDLIRPADFPTLKKYGLKPTMVPNAATIADGIIRKDLHEKLEGDMRQILTVAAEAGAPNVITLSGERKGMNDWEGLDNAVTFLNKVKGMAEDKGITICLELLNSKVDHKDYMCDHTAWGVEVCKRVNSPRVKLLFDIYHMQIMEGDIMRTIRNNFQYLGHFHTAGNPGRHEFDDTQELNYRPIAQLLAELNYDGYIAHEYGPKKDPVESLRMSFRTFVV
jgi:hydroxypyruvate isomerase